MRTVHVRIYDNGGTTVDRYTVVYMDEPERASELYAARGMDADPFHPQGFGQMTTAQPGSHLGRRIKLADLPRNCQRLVLRDCGATGTARESVLVRD